MTNVYNYAHDTTFHTCDSDLKSLIQRSKIIQCYQTKRFESNHMKLNNGKCHFYVVVSMKGCREILARFKDGKVRSKTFQALLLIGT